MSNEINGIDTTGMDAQTIALIRQYAGSSTEQQPKFELSQNGHQRVQEMIQQAGMTRAEAQADPSMMIRATNRAFAEQRGQLPMNEGVNGRNGLGSSTKAVRTGRSLSEMANGISKEGD